MEGHIGLVGERVEVRAEFRLPGRAPKCAVCRETIEVGDRCIWIKGTLAIGSKFYMHVNCSAGVLFEFMKAFNCASNGMKRPEPSKLSKEWR